MTEILLSSMRKDFEKAKTLRLKGSSYKKISGELGIPVSTLSDWFSKIKWSQKIVEQNNEKALAVTLKKLAAMQKARRKQLDEHYENARIEARKEFEQYRKDPLFIAGLCLYWGEGDKRTLNQIRIINSEHALIKIFHTFATKYFPKFDPARIKANVFIYPDLDDQICKAFWSQAIGVPLGQFTQSIRLEGKSSNRLLHGSCNLTICSRFLKEKMLEWLRLLEKEW